MQRRLILTALIHKWSKELRGAIRSVGPDGRIHANEDEPMLVTTAPAHAFHLAGDLASLIDEMIIEEVTWDRFDALAPDNLASYWRITLEFLKIATRFWPEHLEAAGAVDKAQRQMELVRRRVAQIAAGQARGVEIVAGSTGANAATARLIAGIAKSERGAVVLPGLDKSLDDDPGPPSRASAPIPRRAIRRGRSGACCRSSA